MQANTPANAVTTIFRPIPLKGRRAAFAALALAVVAALGLPAVGRVGLSLSSGPAAPAGLPACQVDDLPAERTGYRDWADTIVDTDRRLPAGYEPPDLRRVPSNRSERLREFVVPELERMLAAARADGVGISLTSGYRSATEQAALYRRLVDERGPAYAALSAARAGHSEHQLGTAVDLRGGADWLAANSWRFGFVLSYPAGRSPAWTCYKAESWHFRYFGRERAAEMHASRLSPREWLWLNAR